MARDRTGVFGATVLVLALLLFAGGLLWFGTGYTNQRIREAVDYRRAPLCPETGDADANCVKVVGAVVVKRTKVDTDEVVRYSVDLRTSDRSDTAWVSDDLYKSLATDQEVRLWRFHGKVVAIEHGGVRSGTRDEPGPPYLAGLAGTLVWAAAFGALALLVTLDRARGAPTRLDFRLYFGALAAAVGIIVAGAILDYAAGAVRFDPRLVYVSLALTPAASILVMLRHAWRRTRRA